ncbi:MAG: DUF2619 domain-containing protein [Bacillota bacterium]
MGEGRIISGMAALRIISGVLEIAAALVILRLGRVSSAIRINALLGFIGPLFFLLVSALGIIAIAVNISPWKIGGILLGIAMILWGTA